MAAGSKTPLTGQQIRFLRSYFGKSSRDFAKIIGVTPEQVSRWENGHNAPEKSADKLIRYLAYHGVPTVHQRQRDEIVISV
jgi:DNA-binding transcriptional regulator YiaG